MAQSSIVITEAAADKTLLTLAELRAAAGVSDGSRDADLQILGLRVAASIAAACRVKAAGASIPTLRQETITETFRFNEPSSSLNLSRRPVVEIVSATPTSGALAADAYDLDADAGILYRVSGDSIGSWTAGRAIIVYKAGWDEVPENLKLAASKLVTALWTETARDPSLKRVRVDGISEREYWVSPTDDPLLTQEIDDLLAPYRNHWIG